jgi:hypothetical protein
MSFFCKKSDYYFVDGSGTRKAEPGTLWVGEPGSRKIAKQFICDRVPAPIERSESGAGSGAAFLKEKRGVVTNT